MSKKEPTPEEVNAEEEEISESPQEESKETAGEVEEETTEEKPSAEEETAAEEVEEKEEEEAEEEEEPEEEREEIEVVEERTYTIPLRKVWGPPRGKRTPRAARLLRAFVKRHMKAENVEISNEVNEELWARGIRKPPRKITVRLVKDKEGRVIVYPATA
ncbi:MAG: 50S ribosomal protein L31e [Candidatus Bathyarchaeia archaeon]